MVRCRLSRSRFSHYSYYSSRSRRRVRVSINFINFFGILERRLFYLLYLICSQSRILLYSVFGVFVLLTVALVALHFVQKKSPNKLPEKLRTWEFLPHKLYDALCFIPAPQSPHIYVDVEKNVVTGGLEKEQTMKVASANTRVVQPLATENMYASVKSFNMNQAYVEDVNETNNEDFEEHMKF